MTMSTPVDPDDNNFVIASVISQTNTVEMLLNNIIAKHLGVDDSEKLEQFLELTNHHDRTILNKKFEVVQAIEKEILGTGTLGKKARIQNYLLIRNNFAHNTISTNGKTVLDIQGKQVDNLRDFYTDFIKLQSEIYAKLLEIDKKL